MGFVRHEPCYDRVLLVLTLDKKKMKERVLDRRKELADPLPHLRRIHGYGCPVRCDTPAWDFSLRSLSMTPDGEWSRLGLAPLREALPLEPLEAACTWSRSAGEFLSKGNMLTGDPVRMYAAFRIWNGYLLAREPRRDARKACEQLHG